MPGQISAKMIAAAPRGRSGVVRPVSSTLEAASRIAALSRIVIPDELRARIETMLSEGSSITIQDTGLGPETGDGTDFITVTRSKPRV